jgi:hypothetical protein
MGIKEFASTVVPTGLLSTDEELAVFRWLHHVGSAGKNVIKDNKTMELPFPTQRRHLMSTLKTNRRADTATSATEQ